MTAILETSPTTIDEAIPTALASSGTKHTDSHPLLDTHNPHAVGSDLTIGQLSSDTQAPVAGGDQLPHDQVDCDTQDLPVVGDQTNPVHRRSDTHYLGGGVQTSGSHISTDAQTPRAAGPILRDPLLGVYADVLDDLESVRTANENRLRALTDTSDLGHGLTLDNPDVARLAALVDALKASEHQAVLNLQRSMRKHPLWEWAEPIKGLGQKQFARLLAVVGDPYWNDLHQRPRTVSELWAYCGYHVITSGSHLVCDTQGPPAAGSTSPAHRRSDTHPSGGGGSACHTDQSGDDTQTRTVGVAPKRQRGHKSNWNEDARKRCYLIAESCMKQRGSIYRDVYDTTRAKYADAVHTSECTRCGPKGKPAQVGSPLSLGHQHARGLRAVAKQFLKDLWIESKRLHQKAHP